VSGPVTNELVAILNANKETEICCCKRDRMFIRMQKRTFKYALDAEDVHLTTAAKDDDEFPETLGDVFNRLGLAVTCSSDQRRAGHVTSSLRQSDVAPALAFIIIISINLLVQSRYE